MRQRLNQTQSQQHGISDLFQARLSSGKRPSQGSGLPENSFLSIACLLAAVVPDPGLPNIIIISVEPVGRGFFVAGYNIGRYANTSNADGPAYALLLLD